MSMFWGLSMKPNRKYTQTIVKSFHISGVALEEGELAKLYITADKNKFIVATLSKAIPQMALDLNFCKGDKIMFQTTGNASVSLIGYLHDADESDDEDLEEDEYAAIADRLAKTEGAEDESDDEEGSEEEDDDDKLAAEYSSFLEDNESGEEEEDEDEDDDEEVEEEDDSEEEEESPKAKKAKIAEASKKPAKQNGVAKADQKQQQQQQQQQKSKKDKKQSPEVKKEQPKPKEAKQQPAGERETTGGVKIQDLTAGKGPEAKAGKKVSVYYTGRLKSNNKTFDSMQKGNGFRFGLGAGDVIKGWDVGVVGMKVGGKRRITCPPHMAYGARGHPPTIPPNSTLVFDVELKSIH